MMSRRVATVETVENNGLATGIQKLTTQYGPAINYTELSDEVLPGNRVLINCTANDLRLGTGGYDFVIARLDPPPVDTPLSDPSSGHMMKLRYTPMQLSCMTADEPSINPQVWKSKLNGFPVVCGELHSQIAPICAALHGANWSASYIMTDQAALPLAFSDLLQSLQDSDLLSIAISTGQVSPAANSLSTVTLHNALLAAKWIYNQQAAIVCQGPGQTGTDTKYGFSGVEQAANLDTVAALDGTPIACIRVSSGDQRERHRGISHHTMTVLELVRSRVIVALPEGLDAPAVWQEKHDVKIVARAKTQAALNLLQERGIAVTTMGRKVEEDDIFFHTAAAAGMVAAEIAATLTETAQ